MVPLLNQPHFHACISTKRNITYRRIGLHQCSGLAEPIEQRPGEYKRHEPTEHVADPQIAKGSVEEVLRAVFRFEREDESGNNSRA